MKTVDVDVLVVGAGPTGLTLACDLARRGISVRVIEKSATPFVGSRGKGLQPRTLEVFDDLGIVERVLASGSAYPRMRVHLGFLSLPWDMMERSAASTQTPYPNLWLLPQALTEALLRDRLAELGVGVEYESGLASFEQHEEAITATLADTHRVRARYLVGADGGHSSVRKQLGFALAGSSLDEPSAVVGDVRVDGLDRCYWHVWPRARGGVVALCPLPDGQRFQLFAQLPSHAAMPALDEGAVRDHVAHAIGRPTLGLHEPSWLSYYRPQARMVSRYRERRVFLAGDAAHLHPPTGGQGLNIGVQDAYNLGWKLAAVLRGAPDPLLDSYEAERLPIARDVLGLSTDLYQRRVRSQRRGATTKQLGVNYRGGPLSVDLRSPAKRALQAGDRAPDARLVDGRRLFNLLRGPHLTLLAFGRQAAQLATSVVPGAPARVVHVLGDHEARDSPGCVHDERHELARTYGATTGDVFVIRPDGYLGLCAQLPAPKLLERYLASVAPQSPYFTEQP